MRAYSHFVHISKLSLSIAMVVLLVFLVVIPLMGQDKDGVRLAYTDIEETNAELPVMVNPRFQGVDNKNQPYLVTAATATQQQPRVITLESVAADLTAEDASWLALVAEQGLLNLNEDSLLLQGNVQLYHDKGHEMRTDSVRLDLHTMQAFGETPIAIQGGFGNIQANRFAFLNKGDRMLFQDEVTMVLLP